MFYFLKWVLVLALLAGGAFFLASGLGVVIPLVKYKDLEAQGVPVGVALLVVGVAVAALWKITTSTTVEETNREVSSDGSSSTSRKETKITTSFKPPNDRL